MPQTSEAEFLRRQVQAHLEADLDRGSPWTRYQFVDVTFPASPNTDLDIRHTLKTATPENIRFQVVSADRAVRVYKDTTGTRKAWTTDVIYLRADVASAVCRLLLALERS